MTEADRDAIGLIGFRAWQSSSAFEDAYLDPVVIERVRGEFAVFAKETNCDLVVAEIDGKIVGSAFGAFGGAGINLFGGSVLEEARGRGIYRAMTFARWDMAVERGTPALTVQAGKMSMPICEHLGFELVDRARIFVDELAS